LNIETYSDKYPGFAHFEAAFGFMNDPGDFLEDGVYVRKMVADNKWHFITQNSGGTTDITLSNPSQVVNYTIELYGEDVYGTRMATVRSGQQVLAISTTNLPNTDAQSIAGWLRSTAIGLSGTAYVAPITCRMRRAATDG
jgi:hypothetical protein